MKIKSLLSLFVCGVASQFMVSCSSSNQYFDFSAPATTYHKAAPAQAAPAVEAAVVAPATHEIAPVAATPAQPAPALEANAAAPVASREVARTAPLTSTAVASALAANPSVNAMAGELASAKTNKDVKVATKKIMREAKATKKANALNQYVKIGLILLVAGALLSLIPGLGLVGAVAAIVGLVFILLGLLEM
ncbi:hypothetical protein ACD591_15545 [Rufibacter glacialis]|uniref:Uncharacterized protein n=1 Tax=Rufibacter glacialis TaxID=1259555 RepID=A0A5M8QRL9_9BACT|nr:hypothetical protein [Rufibacter glacialis]KAA6437634.1 hypothetical protein FOE74_03795 [Rufibacter glacialis]GGK57672.1 hypothetical protein GCM10011405_02170 [Rufibacter glacialis]